MRKWFDHELPWEEHVCLTVGMSAPDWPPRAAVCAGQSGVPGVGAPGFGELSEGVVTGVCCVLGLESTLEAFHGVELWHCGVCVCVCVQGRETRSKLARSFFLRNLFLILKYEGSRKRVLLWSSCCQSRRSCYVIS